MQSAIGTHFSPIRDFMSRNVFIPSDRGFSVPTSIK